MVHRLCWWGADGPRVTLGGQGPGAGGPRVTLWGSGPGGRWSTHSRWWGAAPGGLWFGDPLGEPPPGRRQGPDPRAEGARGGSTLLAWPRHRSGPWLVRNHPPGPQCCAPRGSPTLVPARLTSRASMWDPCPPAAVVVPGVRRHAAWTSRVGDTAGPQGLRWGGGAAPRGRGAVRWGSGGLCSRCRGESVPRRKYLRGEAPSVPLPSLSLLVWTRAPRGPSACASPEGGSRPARCAGVTEGPAAPAEAAGRWPAPKDAPCALRNVCPAAAAAARYLCPGD